MRHNYFPRLSARLVFGLLIVFLGILFTLDNLDVLDAGSILRFWPAVFVVFGLMKLMRPGDGPGHVIGLVFVVGGSLMVLDRLGLSDFGWREFWPLLLIAAGGGLLWSSLNRRRRDASPEEGDSAINLFALMGGYERKLSSPDFHGGELTAIMGAIELDLRQSDIKEETEAVLNIFALWGGIDIRVPEDWSVVVEASPIMGGIEERTHPPKGGSTKRLLIRGNVIMGGVEIHN